MEQAAILARSHGLLPKCIMQATDIMRKQVRQPVCRGALAWEQCILSWGGMGVRLGWPLAPRVDLLPIWRGPWISASGASYSFPIPHRQVPGLKVLSSQGPRVEILAKNLRVKDQMPQGAPR